MKKLLLTFIILLIFANLRAQVTCDWQPVNIQGMGFVTGIIGHPTTDNLVYARTDNGGVYRWDENNSSWIQLLDDKGILELNVESIALDPKNDQILLAAIGNNTIGNVYRSVDQGNTWQPTNLNVYMFGNGAWRHTGERLSLDGNLALFGSRQNGLFRSTDGGINWTLIPPTQVPIGTDGGHAFTLIHPTNNNIIYVGVQGHGVYRSSDQGTSWNLLPGGPTVNFKPVSADISNNGNVYITYATDFFGADGRVYKYTGSGNLQNVTPSFKTSNGYAGISVEKTNANHVVTFQWNAGPENNLQRSLDGGASWTPLVFNNGILNGQTVNVTEPPYYPSWSSYTIAGNMLIQPTNPSKVWFTTGFGVYKTDNISGTPAQWNAEMKNFEQLVPIAVKSPPNQPKEFITVTADMVGFAHNDANTLPTSKLVPNNFGIGSGIDYCVSNPNVIAFVGSDQGGVFDPYTGISQDGGLTWQSFPSIPGNANNGNIAISATDPDTMVWAPLSVNYSPKGDNIPVYVTRDGGVSWNPASNAPLNINPIEQFWFASQALVSDKINGSKFYIYDRGSIYSSQDYGENWSRVSSFTLPWDFKAILKASPDNEGELYYTRPHQNDPIYKSINGGITWTQISSMNSCYNFGFGKPLPGSSNSTIYMAGVVNGVRGLFFSTDSGLSWQQIESDGIHLYIDRITTIEGNRDIEGRVYVGINGRGFFQASMDVSTLSTNDIYSSIGAELSVIPNPSINGSVEVYYDNWQGTSLELFNLKGQSLLKRKMTNKIEKLNISSYPTGILLLKVNNNKDIEIKKIVHQ